MSKSKLVFIAGIFAVAALLFADYQSKRPKMEQKNTKAQTSAKERAKQKDATPPPSFKPTAIQELAYSFRLYCKQPNEAQHDLLAYISKHATWKAGLKPTQGQKASQIEFNLQVPKSDLLRLQKKLLHTCSRISTKTTTIKTTNPQTHVNAKIVIVPKDDQIDETKGRR